MARANITQGTCNHCRLQCTMARANITQGTCNHCSLQCTMARANITQGTCNHCRLQCTMARANITQGTCNHCSLQCTMARAVPPTLVHVLPARGLPFFPATIPSPNALPQRGLCRVLTTPSQSAPRQAMKEKGTERALLQGNPLRNTPKFSIAEASVNT